MMEQRYMLQYRNCCCVTVETAVFIFAVFSAIISGFGTVVFATARIWYAALSGDQYFDQVWDSDPDVYLTTGDKIYEQRMMDYMAVMISMMFFFFCCLVSFIFSVFLCYGIHKRRPGFVRAYLFYGVTLVVLMMAAGVIYGCLSSDLSGGSLVLMACVLYTGILLMIKHAYILIQADQSFISDKLLCAEPGLKG